MECLHVGDSQLGEGRVPGWGRGAPQDSNTGSHSPEETEVSLPPAAAGEERGRCGCLDKEAQQQAHSHSGSPLALSFDGSNQAIPNARNDTDGRQGESHVAGMARPGSPASSPSGALVYSTFSETFSGSSLQSRAARLSAVLRQIARGSGAGQLEPRGQRDPQDCPAPRIIGSMEAEVRPPLDTSRVPREGDPASPRGGIQQNGWFSLPGSSGVHVKMQEEPQLHVMAELLKLQRDLSHQQIDLQRQKQRADTHREELEALRRRLLAVDGLQSSVTALEATARGLQAQLAQQDAHVQRHKRVLAEQQRLLRAQALELSEYVSECEGFFNDTKKAALHISTRHREEMQLVKAVQVEELRKVRQEWSDKREAMNEGVRKLEALSQMVHEVDARTKKLEQTQRDIRVRLEKQGQFHEEVPKQVRALDARQAENLATACRDGARSLRDVQCAADQHRAERELADKQETRHCEQEKELEDLVRELTQLRDDLHRMVRTVAIKDEIADEENSRTRTMEFYDICPNTKGQLGRMHEQVFDRAKAPLPGMKVPEARLAPGLGANIRRQVGERERQAQQRESVGVLTSNA